MGDTPVKSVQNRQYIDNVSDYDSEHYRISKSVCHKLDLGPISLPGAQQHTTVETAAALEIQDNTKGDFEAHIQSAMMGDTPVKTVQNRQCIDNVSDHDSEHHRISKSVHHRLDLGPISLPGAQQHTTVESAAALKIQDKIECKFKAHM